MTTLPQAPKRVLKAIGSGFTTATAIKDHLGMLAQNVSNALAFLKALELVNREQSQESLRVFNLSLTEKGEAAYKTISEESK